MTHESHVTDGHTFGSHATQCADFLQSIVYLLDNELAEGDVAVVRMHLDQCNPCFATYDTQKRVKELVARSCSETAPDELRLRIVALCREVQQSKAD